MLVRLSTQSDVLPWAIGDFVKAVNRANPDALLDTLADDALVNDIRREFWGRKSIGKWAEKEIFSVNVTMEVISVREHYDDFIVAMKLDGDYDKTGLPDPLILSFYFTLHGDKIARLIILHNKMM